VSVQPGHTSYSHSLQSLNIHDSSHPTCIDNLLTYLPDSSGKLGLSVSSPVLTYLRQWRTHPSHQPTSSYWLSWSPIAPLQSCSLPTASNRARSASLFQASKHGQVSIHRSMPSSSRMTRTVRDVDKRLPGDQRLVEDHNPFSRNLANVIRTSQGQPRAFKQRVLIGTVQKSSHNCQELDCTCSRVVRVRDQSVTRSKVPCICPVGFPDKTGNGKRQRLVPSEERQRMQPHSYDGPASKLSCNDSPGLPQPLGYIMSHPSSLRSALLRVSCAHGKEYAPVFGRHSAGLPTPSEHSPDWPMASC
jgi:hypothetical protein